MKKKSVQVERGIRLPKRATGGRPPKYPWKQLKVGHSFFVKGVPRASLAPLIYRSQRLYKMKLSYRTVEGGIRIWRVK